MAQALLALRSLCCLYVASSGSMSASPVLISHLSVSYLLPPNYSLDHWFNFSANPAPEIELTSLPQYILQVPLKPPLILFLLTSQRPRLCP